MPGPPPKPAHQRARRNATIAMTPLPAEGRQGPPPKWPLPDDVRLKAELTLARAQAKDAKFRAGDPDLVPRARAKADQALARAQHKVTVLSATLRAARRHEQQLWDELWATPQAVMWQRLRWDREVAQYVRWKVRAELGDMAASQEARHLSDRLGLNPMALLRLRWEIRESPAGGGAQTTPAASGSRARYADLRVVGGSGA